MSELEKCPFCGGAAFPNIELRKHWVECRECAAESGCYRTEVEAIAAWNTRAELGSGTCEMYRDEHGTWHCKSCESGADTDTGSDGTLDAWCDAWPPNYCPNCGRKVNEKHERQLF